MDRWFTVSFEVYEPSMRGEDRAMVGLRKSGALTPNVMAQKVLGVDVEWVILMYDRAKRRIAIKAATEDDTNALKARRYWTKGANRPYMVIQQIKFFRRYNIPLDGRRLPARYDNGMLVISLDEGGAREPGKGAS